MGNLIYILGCARSGTTLLQNLFRCAADTVILNGEVPPALLYRAKSILDDDTKHIVGKRCSQEPIWGSSFGGTDPYRVDRTLKKETQRILPPGSLFERDETVPWMDWLLGWRDIWHVHIRRDPRDVVVSKAGVQYLTTLPLWKNAETVYDRLVQENPGRTLLVSYENLVANPQDTIDSLFTSISLTSSTLVANWTSTVLEAELPIPALKRMRAVDTKSVGKWKSSDEAKARLKAQIAEYPDFMDLLVSYNYETDINWSAALSSQA